MGRLGRAARRLAVLALPLNGVVALGLTLVYLVAGRLSGRPAAPLPRVPRWWHLGTAFLVAAVCLAPTPYLPWSNPARIDPATDNLIIVQDVARWNPSLMTPASVPLPATGQTAACAALPPGRALTHTVPIPRRAAQWTGSLYVLSAAGDDRPLVFRVGPPGSGGQEVDAPVDGTWRRLVATTTSSADQTAMTLALFNPDPAQTLTLCVGAAQLEAGGEATEFRSLVARLEGSFPAAWLRWTSALVVLVGSYLLWGLVAVLTATGGASVGGSVAPLLVGLVASLVTVIVQALTGDGRPAGLAGHANILGAQAAVVAGLLAASLSGGRHGPGGSRAPSAAGRPGTLVALVGIAVVVGIVVLSGSRAAALALVFGAVTWSASAGRRGRWAGVVVLAALVTVAAAWELRGAPVSGGWDSSRVSIYSAAARAWLASPIVGWGPGTAASRIVIEASGSMSDVPAHAHSLFLQVAVEYGALGLAAIAMALWSIVVALRSRPAWWPALGIVLPLAALDLAVVNPNVYVCLLWCVTLAARERAGRS